LAATAVTWQLLPESRRFAPQRRTTSWRGLRGAFTRQLAVTLLIGFNVLFVQVAAFSYIVFHLSAPPFSLGTGVLSGIFVTYLAGAGVTPIAGPFIDRLGSRRVLMRALGGGMVGALVTLAPSVPAIVLGLAICASCTFICQSASTAYLRVAAAPEVRALASGLYVTAYYTGGSVGGVVPGFLWSAARWPGCVALMLSVQAMTLLLAHRFWRGPASLLHQRGIGG
ncbi:MAG TPA: MFS transporter, partial [Myxococcota bacterium]|nr:MFS transporter [Myxococcota bacterium]